MNHETLIKQFDLIKSEMDWENNKKSCQAILESTYYILNKDHWKVIGITELAYNLIVSNGFFVLKNGRSIVCRAHIYDRRETFLNVMYNNWNNGQEIYDYMISRDICYLSAKNENKKGNQLTSYINVPKELNLFKPKEIGFLFDKKIERQWLTNVSVK